MRTAGRDTSRRSRARTLASDLERIARRAANAKAVDFGAYRGRPAAFFDEVLNVQASEPQVEVLNAVEARRKKDGGARTSVPSGRAMGKSLLDAGMGIHFAATEGPRALVIFTAPTFKQVQRIIWREVRNLIQGARVSLGVSIAKLASTGAEFSDGSLMLGMVGDSPEAFAGLRAPRMRVIADESSGIADETFVALEGNLAGGGDLILTGNPTKDEGYFYESFTKPELAFDVVRLPSTRSPNVIAGKIVVPGMATREWIEARATQWGRDSAMFKIHVLGEAANLASSRLYPADVVREATKRWAKTTPRGRIIIGLDPAGERGLGDESSFAPRRGDKVLWIRRRRGLSEDGHVVEVTKQIGEIRGHASNANDPSVRKKALVVVDRDGADGAKVYAALVAAAIKPGAVFEVIGVRGSDRARRQPKDVDRVRDELAMSLVPRLRTLAIPDDPKLHEEMAKIRVVEIDSGRAKIVGKRQLRRELDRSPDSFDSLALSAYYDDDAAGIGSTENFGTPAQHTENVDRGVYDNVFDPYGDQG